MTALYRAYRPQRFDDVVGQQAAVRTLRNAIANGKVAHAYLFTGSKGTGKTTLAKLLAKAMNCVHGPTEDPCGECESCRSIAEGRSMDVIEIDAASNRGIDDVREKIIESVAYRPSTGTRRVYILDEAHQLTPAAFNALLKTIEEPPDHVLFVFCTTELHQMMATVRDRCQRLVLAPPTPDQLLEVLRRVATTEGIEADDQALRAIARVAQGSFRNAIGTLEMLSTALGTSFTHADVLEHLGAFAEDLLFDVADAVVNGDAAAVLATVESLTQGGADLEQFARELAEHLREVLLALHGVQGFVAGVSDTARLQAQAQAADEQRVLAAIDCLNDALTRIRVGSDPRLAVETSLVRACQGLGLPSLALRLAQVEHRVAGGYGQPLAAPAGEGRATPPPAPVTPVTPPAAPVAQPAAPHPAEAAATQASTPAPAAPPAAEPAPPAAAPAQAAPNGAPPAAPTGEKVANDAQVAAAPDPANVAEWWPRVVAAASPAARSVLGKVTGVKLDGDRLLVRVAYLPASCRQELAKLAAQAVGRPVSIDVTQAGNGADPTPGPDMSMAADAAPATPEPAAAPPPPTPAPTPGPADTPAPASDDELALFQSTFNATPIDT